MIKNAFLTTLPHVETGKMNRHAMTPVTMAASVMTRMIGRSPAGSVFAREAGNTGSALPPMTDF